MRKYANYEESLKARLADAAYAREYLAIALEEYEENGDLAAFLLAVRDVTEAQGGVSKLAARHQLNRQGLYKVLSENGNPQLNTISMILHGLGFKLSIDPLESSPQ